MPVLDYKNSTLSNVVISANNTLPFTLPNNTVVSPNSYVSDINGFPDNSLYTSTNGRAGNALVLGGTQNTAGFPLKVVSSVTGPGGSFRLTFGALSTLPVGTRLVAGDIISYSLDGFIPNYSPYIAATFTVVATSRSVPFDTIQVQETVPAGPFVNFVYVRPSSDFFQPITIGFHNNNTSYRGTCIGTYNYVAGYQLNFCVGNYNYLQAYQSGIIGNYNVNLGTNSYTLGNYLCSYNGFHAIAIGNSVAAKDNYSVAIGARNGSSSINNTIPVTTKTEQIALCATGGVFIPGQVGIGTDSTANALTVNGTISSSNIITDVYGPLLEQGVRSMRNYRRFAYNVGGVGGVGSAVNPVGGYGISLNSGNGATSYATAGYAHSFGTYTKASGGAINFNDNIGWSGMGLLIGASTTNGFGARFIIGDPNNGGAPIYSNLPALADRGFGWALLGNGSAVQYHLFAHTGTAYLSSTPVTTTAFTSLNRMTHWWVRNNRAANQIELYIASGATDFTLTPPLPSTPTAVLPAALLGLNSSSGRYCTANIITNGIDNPGSQFAMVMGYDEMLFTYGV